MSESGADEVAVSIAKEIARKALEGDYDILLACRDISDLRNRLPTIPDWTMDPLIGVASEVDNLPLGNERQHWAADALRLKDQQAAAYRNSVAAVVRQALQELLTTLERTPQRLGS